METCIQWVVAALIANTLSHASLSPKAFACATYVSTLHVMAAITVVALVTVLREWRTWERRRWWRLSNVTMLVYVGVSTTVGYARLYEYRMPADDLWSMIPWSSETLVACVSALLAQGLWLGVLSRRHKDSRNITTFVGLSTMLASFMTLGGSDNACSVLAGRLELRFANLVLLCIALWLVLRWLNVNHDDARLLAEMGIVLASMTFIAIEVLIYVIYGDAQPRLATQGLVASGALMAVTLAGAHYCLSSSPSY